MITVQVPSFAKTIAHLVRLKNKKFMETLAGIGDLGVKRLAENTPKDTGVTSESWSYEIKRTSRGYQIIWTNSVMAGSAPLVVLIRYGHSTGTGGYVKGRNFISPAYQQILSEVLDRIATEVQS